MGLIFCRVILVCSLDLASENIFTEVKYIFTPGYKHVLLDQFISPEGTICKTSCSTSTCSAAVSQKVSSFAVEMKPTTVEMKPIRES